jgi:hydrogenase nickel incorporation protein HypA/HybF
MHELSICQALVEQVETIAAERRSSARRVYLGIGPLAGVEPQLLIDAYPLVCAGTAAEGSQLCIEKTEIRVRCRGCGAETIATANRLVCGACGDWHTELLTGDEMVLLKVELERRKDAPVDAQMGDAQMENAQTEDTHV